jgi:hypothetical protein
MSAISLAARTSQGETNASTTALTIGPTMTRVSRQGQDEHVEYAAAKEVTGRQVGRSRAHRKGVGDDLGRQSSGCDQERADKHAP